MYKRQPIEEIPGENIILPENPYYLQIDDKNLFDYRRSLIKNTVKNLNEKVLYDVDVDFICEETRLSKKDVLEILNEFQVVIK